MAWEKELDVGLRAVRAAAQVCRSVQRSITPETLAKQDKSPVTIADFASQAIVCRALAESFPQDAVIAEEEASALLAPENETFVERMLAELRAAGVAAVREEVAAWIDHGRHTPHPRRFWTLDPIDGTKGFLRGEQYAISLALIVEGRIEVAVLGCPNLPAAGADNHPPGAVFTAVRGGGAQVRPLDDVRAPPRPVHTSPTRNPAQARLCESVESGHSAHGTSAEIAARLGLQHPPVRLDSQAKYAVVARGEADIYLRLPTKKDYREKIWDHAGGVLVVEEAGGRVTDVEGRLLDFTCGAELVRNRGVVATNGGLHEPVLAAVASVLGRGGTSPARESEEKSALNA